MPLLIKDDRACLFVHVPKAGGSRFEALASELGWTELLSIRGVHANRLKALRASPQHFHAAVLESFLDFSRIDEVLLICRDPFERFKSEYYWQLEQGMTTDSPASWTERVLSELDDDPWVYDNHLRPQHEFVVTTARTEVFKLEDDGVEKAFGCLCRDNADALVEARQVLVNLDVRTSKKTRRPDSLESAFSSLEARIRQRYRRDCERFGYPVG